MNEDVSLNHAKLKDFREKSINSEKHRALQNAIMNNGIQKVSLNNESAIRLQYTFSDEIRTGKVTAQKKSGRCWIFAGTNMLRTYAAKNIGLKDFELSENYLFFWDKLEKSNFFLENIIKTLDEEIYSRLVMWLLDAPVQDGGQWDMFSNLVKKYGVVPKNTMPETFHSSNSKKMDAILTTKLREYAATLRKLYKKGKSCENIKIIKMGMLSEIYHMLCMFLGTPPEKFDFEVTNDEGRFIQDIDITPTEFFGKYIDIDLYDYISIINAPSEDKPFGQTYTVNYLGNVIEGRKVFYLNVDKDTMKKLALTQIKQHHPVWFGCDVGKMSDRGTGILDTELFLYEESLDVPFRLTKGERLTYGESKLTHAMLFTGVNIRNGVPTRWKVENSWGNDAGNNGFFVMSDRWFEDYNYQIVIKREFLEDDLLDAIKKKPIELCPWDPMGSLAVVR